MIDPQSTRDLRRRLATSALLVTCESIADTGRLPLREESYLRLLIADVRAAFGPDIPERELPNNVVSLTGYAEQHAQRILDAVAAEMQK